MDPHQLPVEPTTSKKKKLLNGGEEKMYNRAISRAKKLFFVA